MTALVLSSPTATGAAVGAVAGLGLWLVLARVAARRPSLDSRLAPYLRPRPTRSSLLTVSAARTPFPVVERLLAPVMADAVRVAERVGSPSSDVRRRLVRAGRTQSVEQFRAEQVVWTVVGAAAGLGLALVLAATRGTGTAAGTALVAVCALTGLVCQDQLLTAQVRRRERLLLAELPTVAELLALAVTAGEGALGGLERVVRTARGALAAELRTVVADARSGTSLPVALDRLADRTGVVALARFCEAVSVAVERGTPLADVLRAQAQDARAAGRRELMETGGRKELAMMVPVVFLILPVTVVFAVFPGLLALRMDL
ncbi:type II secretion system F family protein [Cellulomonas carbonis]|uniref:Pilus assembly protein TadB n=1 Tax=Cellulomonas carbonis T26 TaxID=947969 RepID=A0A0A0BP85_9CELL|nr:type II secretion system F family protein [Cellulomonas carbonis]KGM09502.1 pilus assembly protein TadB [Cellulomonas carbonis T26]GGB98825.1 pilus assembly protein TadB [Cellulomonas carbonis]